MVLRSIYLSRLTVLLYLSTCFAWPVCANTVVFMGLEHTSLGSASLELTAQNSLRVFNLANSGNDGVAINLGNADYINIGKGDEDGKNGSGSTKGKSISAIGSVGGAVNQFLGGSSVELANDLFSMALLTKSTTREACRR